MFYRLTYTLFSVILLVSLLSCVSETPTPSDVESVKLEEFDTFVTVEENQIALPSIIKYDSDSSHLFVYDTGIGSVLELNGEGEVVTEYGQRGRGPGEFQLVNNIFLSDDRLYVVDEGQFFIHRFDREGEFLSTMDYSEYGGMIPPPPMGPGMIRAPNINNKPIITPEGHVLLSTVQAGQRTQEIYELRDWDGNHLSDIGEVPEGSSFELNYDKLREDIMNGDIPSFYRTNAFPVSDRTNPQEYFLIYNAIPSITKYDSDGQRLWEHEVSRVSEIDSISTYFFETMEQMQRSNPRNRINLAYYVSGVSSQNGGLYLAMDRIMTDQEEIRPLLIHQFNAEGELIRQFNLISEDIEIQPIFDIDFTGRRIFVVTEEADIRVYPF